jgi:PAS domain S-box-containing protein
MLVKTSHGSLPDCPQSWNHLAHGISERDVLLRRSVRIRAWHGEEPGDGQDIRLVVDTIPTLAWSAGPDGSAEFHSQRWLDYTGLSAKQALGPGWEVAIHPDDLPRILETFREALNSGKPYEVEGRFRRFDGEFRWFLFRASPLCE